MRKTVIFVLLVLLAMLAMPAASAATMTVVADPPQVFSCDPTPILVTINVTDESTGTPIDGANVKFRGTYWYEDNTTTNGECTFSITNPYDPSGKFCVDVNATGYDDVFGIEIPIYPCNGYKGKSHTGGPNMTTWKTYDLNGDLLYSAGNSYYQGCSAAYGGDPDWTAYNVAWTAGDLPVPGTATIKEARLYAMYTWDKQEVMSTNVSVDFNGVTQTPDAHYQDEKMYLTSNPYGMLVYNVTADFDTGGNIADLTNSYPGGDNVSMRGMMLMVIYEDACELRKQIFVNEEFDLLYGGSAQYTTPEEATAWAPITGPAIMAGDVSARLITFAPGADGSGSAGEGELIFNGQVWDDEWTDNEVHQIGTSDRDVTSYLQSTGNLVGFQSNADYMEASNAILIVEAKPNATVYFEPSDIRVPEYCNTETVGVWINSSAALASGTIIFDYTFCCANVTSFAQDPVNFPGLSGEIIAATLTPGRVKIDFATGLLDGFPANIPVRIGNMTIHCCNPSDFCMTDLAWNCTDPEVNLMDAGDVAITPVKYEDGTFMCNIPDLEVTWVKGTGNDTHYNVTCTVNNTGKADAIDVYATLMVDDPVVFETMFMGALLGPGNETTETFTSLIKQTGTVDNLTVCADYDDTIVELDEGNNCMNGRYPGEIVVSIQPVVTYVQPQDQFDVKVYIDTKGMEVYAVQYRLTYDTSVVRAETQTKDTFLGPISETWVIVNEIDQPHGEASYAETRKVLGGVTDSDNVTNVHFIAIGERGDTTNLTLDDIILSGADGVPIAYRIENGSVEITENTPPVPVGVSKHRTNNVAQKYQCISTLCSCSYDLDYPGKGGNISYIRWAFGDGQYGTSEGLPVDNCTCKEHRYESWQWDPLGDPYPDGDYVPFDVQLEVTDDGCPEITNATNFTINVYIAGDANGDGEVNVLDAVWVGKYWRKTCSGDPYDPMPDLCDGCEDYLWNNTGLPLEDNERADGADLNNDCEINVLDAVIIGANWRHTAW